MTSPDVTPRDPYLELDLSGLHLIEASAGTGKTFTLATLVTRLVIERGLRVGQILAVTFTIAATQELRERLRQRLDLAARIAADDPALPEHEDDAARALTRALIDAQRRREDAGVLRARLQRAAHEIDLAAVFTIHGFCARVLAEYALEAGQPLRAPELVGSERALREEVATDLWRALGADADVAELLQAQWTGPDALAADLGLLLRAQRLLPSPPADTPDPLPALQLAGQALRAAFAQYGDDARMALDTAVANKVINGNSYQAAWRDALWAELDAFSAHGDLARELDARIERLTPEALFAKTNKGRHAHTPQSPLFAAVAPYRAAWTAREAWREQRRIALVHRVRAEAGARLARLKQQRQWQTYDDLIDGVADALDGAHGDTLAERLRGQYAVALVDEFQDTDARQWAIFRRVFGPRDDDPGALLLIGDPKQAIYRFRGGDVHTYLAAAQMASPAPPLAHNFRSRPGLLRALAALYARAGDEAFVDPRIRFHPVAPGGRIAEAGFQRGGAAAPALTVRVLPAPGDAPAWKSEDSRARAAQACVAAIHAVLGDASAMIDGRRVQPGDVAVLVRKHDEATRMQWALSALGIPAVAAGRESLFATEQAQQLRALFVALLRPDDDGRLRAALATVLLGLDAGAIERLDHDDSAHRLWQLRAQAWRERWERHGPLALVADLAAEHAPRLLALVDGERRLTNLLQLGEALQEADQRALGLHGLVDWLEQRIHAADPNDETQQLRLESDAQRVQILTLHKSKGLEFPLVFLPFAGIGGEPRTGRLCEVITADGRALQLKVGRDGDPDWAAAVEAAAVEERAEDARLLYVGLTRAQHALWLASGPLYAAQASPLTSLLGDPATLATDVAGDIVIESGAAASQALRPLALHAPVAVPAARTATRVLDRDWWVYSFTQLAHAGSDDRSQAPRPELGERGADDEAGGLIEPPQPAGDPRYSGSRFGNVLHGALERVDFAAWAGWRGGPPPPTQAAPLRAAFGQEGYGAADSDDGLPLLTTLVGATLNVALPEGLRLGELAAEARRMEMEFHFALAPTATDALLALLHQHGVLRDRAGFGARRRLEGLMTGKIDLVYTHNDQVFLLDYKSNRLPAYDAASLDAAMHASEYTLQALLYTLALHRWLRFRRGVDYDYARDFGGVRYLFCRGLDASHAGAAGADAPGVYAAKPAQALVEALDALFAGQEAHA